MRLLQHKERALKITGQTTLDHAPQVVAEWLNELREDMGWVDKGRTYLLLRTGLHVIRDSLPETEAADIAAQLPLLLKGIWWDGWSPSRAHSVIGRDAMLRAVAQHFVNDPLDEPEVALRAVHDLLARHVSAGEMQQADASMRKNVRGLWQ